MPLRVPPGRAGRLWLVRRLETARRGLAVLEQKQQALLREQVGLAATRAQAREAWVERAREAAAWGDRTTAVAGERRLRLAAAHVAGPCTVAVTWRNALGTALPVHATVDVPEPTDLVALGGGSTVALAAKAHAEALAAAATEAATRAALEAVQAELAATSRRQRAIERRWIPEHEAELRRVELALDEREREEVARVRRAAR